MQVTPPVGPAGETPSEPDTAEEAVLQLMMTIGRRFRQRQSGDIIDPAQAGLLYALTCHGAMRLGDVAETMHLDASTVSRHVQQLADRGLLQRDPDPEDGRARIIAISDTGRDALSASFDRRRAFMRDALSGWTDVDRDQLRTLLYRLTTDLGDHE